MNSAGYIPVEDNIRVLLIESMTTVNDTLKGILQADEKLVFDVATTKVEAFNLLKDELYECIVVSDEVEGDDTFRLVNNIKKKYAYPLILTSKKNHSDISDMAYRSGVDEILNSIQKQGKLAILASNIRKNVEGWRSDYLYNQLLNKNIDAIVIIDAERIVFANKQASEIMGIDDLWLMPPSKRYKSKPKPYQTHGRR